MRPAQGFFVFWLQKSEIRALKPMCKAQSEFGGAMKQKKSNVSSELRLELKYCERCGGLWLRPVGGNQIYCTKCGRAMAELPPPTKKPAHPKLPCQPRWSSHEWDGSDFESNGNEKGFDFDASGGAA
jgi:hypothetical protein